jgi:ribosomal protein L40E
MTSDQYQEFNGSGCNEIHPAVLTREQVSSFSFDWVVPQDGLFYIIFLNLHSALDVQITFSATTVLPFTLTSTIYSTIMQSTAVTLTSSVLSTGEVPQASLDMNSFGSNYLFIVAAIVIALLIVIFLLMRRGRSTTKRRPSSRPASGKTVSAEMYCRKCGAKIPRDSTFCLECGSKI